MTGMKEKIGVGPQVPTKHLPCFFAFLRELRVFAVIAFSFAFAGCVPYPRGPGSGESSPAPSKIQETREGGEPKDGAWKSEMEGVASWYGEDFNGRLTASGEVYDMYKYTAAHKTLPFGTVVKVINLDNGKSVEVTVNDRGPYVKGRIIDLSRTAGRAIDIRGEGTARVRLEKMTSVRNREPRTNSEQSARKQIPSGPANGC